MGYRSDKKNTASPLLTLSLHKNRVFILGVILSLSVFSLIGRLFYIQLIKGNDYHIRGINQWSKEIPIGIKRGNIYDRNLIPLTNRHRSNFLVIFPDYFPASTENLKLISSVTGLSPDEIKNMEETSTRPMEVEISNFDQSLIKRVLLIKGVFPIESNVRYDANSLASHVIGYINKIDNTGEKGIEKNFDEILKENQSYKISASVDAQKRIIPGLGYKILSTSMGDQRKNVLTTLDYELQKIVEQELDKNHVNGSAVVLDGQSGDVLAMASRPNFQQDHVVDYLDSDEKELFNRSIQMPYPPGSVFKIIVAAAALENGIPIDEHFFCKGYEELGDITIKCSSFDQNGHGNISFEEAFSLSCNAAFIQIGQKIGGDKILDMAGRFGLGASTEIGLSEEISGQLPTEDYMKGPGIGNISIGQGTLEVTPIQIARITSIIANDGVDKGIRLIKGFVDDDVKIISENNPKDPRRIISPDTARKIKGMMEKVVSTGTGKLAQLEEGGGAAGKTSSAEAISNGEKTVHAWFTGYFPINDPKYIITILVEDGSSGGRAAAPLFKNIAEGIYPIK